VATVYDPRGHVFKEVSFTLDESGFNELSFTTTEGSPTGSWSVYLRIAEDYKNNLKAGIYLGSTTVAVREFEPDRMKAELRLTPSAVKGWVKPDELSATLKAENLFGAPAQERRVSSTLILNPVEFHFGEHQNYHFYDGFSISGRDKFEISLEDTTTDERGEANLSLLLHEHERASYHLSIIANVFEAGSGRSVTATAQTSISPNDYLVGAKADGDVGYIKKGVERTLNFIAVNQNLEKIDLGNLSIEIVEQKYISVLTLQSSGVYKYQSKLQEVQLSQKAFAISKNGTDYRLDSKKPATYKLLVKNAQGDILYKSYYGIVGDANIDRSLERNSELELKLSKAEYKNGEEIEISINTPYIGSGLITIEKDKVYAWKWFKTTTTSSIQKITVPAELKGNGYVNVQFVRDPNSNDIFMSPLSYGVLPFKVNQQSKSAHVELVSTKLAKPGNDINFSVKTNGKQKVVVFAVDEGILQVADYHLNNPLGFFFQKRYLGVRSHQILDLILPEFSKFETLASAAGGGDDVQASEANKHLNPFKRKVDKPVVFWSGIVEVNGEKQFSYKVPDYFNGKLRVMAVAVSPKQIGIAQSSSTVRDDFVLSPNVPFVAAPNDEFEVTLGVSNNIENLNKTLPINVSLVASEHLQIVGNSTAVISLAQMSEGFVKFRLKATKHLGSGDLIFRANYEDKESKKSYFTQRIGTISVRPVTPFRTVSVMGRMGKESESVKDMRSMYDEYALRDASIGFTPMVLSNGLFSYLENYPHYCSEQLVSQAISAMIADKYSPQSAKIQHENVASILKSRQNSNGAIGLWRTTAYGDSFVSVYAAHYLIEAQENGIVISSDILQNLNSYLSDLANYNDAEDIEGLRLRSYALYLLTRQGVITTNTLSSVQKALQLHSEKTWQNDISALYIAATYKMLKMDKEADLLLSKAWKELGRAYDNAWWSRDYYDPLVINSAAIYLISKHFPQKLKSIPPQALENIVLMIRSGRFTTTSSAMSVLAIDSYSAQLEEFSKNSKDNKSLSIEAISADNLTRVISTHNGLITSANFTKKDVGITFKNPLKLPAWYSVVQEGYDENVSAQAIKKGLEVYREFKDESGNQISTLKLGDKVNVTIRVRSNSNEGVGNVAIIDLLPGGFEVVQQPLKQQDYADDEYEDEYDDDDSFISPIAFGATTLDVDYSDIREDRVIIYARVGKDIGEFTYQIKPTNVGTYRIPPVFAEAMYDREIQGVSAENGTITVLAVE
ncbi:MAG: alpha-2-macroglobulin family protein, partial [Campylobacteraceae bacterium]|nr:alpha-2-macroglobulin family protein [Campylobacteraceae bacterium]